MENDAPESIQKIGTKLASTLKENTQEALQNIAEKTREVIQNPAEALESTKSAVKNNWKVITLFIVIALIIWFLIYMFRPNNKKNADSVLNHSNVYRMWELAPIGTNSTFQTMSEDLPPTEDEMTYIMNLYIEDWNGTPTTGHRELFHHGPSQCCEIKDDDVINVQFDHTKNDLYIHVRTELNCGEIPYKNAKQLASTKDYLFLIAEDNKSEEPTNHIFIQNLDGSSCWRKLSTEYKEGVEPIIKGLTYPIGSSENTIIYDIVGIDTIILPDQEDEIYLLVKDSNDITFICKLNQLNKPRDGELPAYEVVWLKNKTTKISSRVSNKYNFTSNRLDENRIIFGYKKKQKIWSRSEEKWDVSYNGKNIDIESLNGDIVGINKENKVFYCAPSDNTNGTEDGADNTDICEEIEQTKTMAVENSLSIDSISADESKLWGISFDGKQIYSTNNISSGEWNLRKQLSSEGTLSNIHASSYSKHRIWSLYDQDGSGNIVIPLSKSTSTNINSGLELDSQPTTKETVTIQNIPIGNPFQLAITITKKTVEVYINGKLYGTKVFKGTRPDDNSVKALRFFGTQSKINGTIHNFIFAPFPVSISSIQGIAITEKPGSVKKESLLQKCTSYFF
jgi:hypothetical protein